LPAHCRAGGNPVLHENIWIPAFAGTSGADSEIAKLFGARKDAQIAFQRVFEAVLWAMPAVAIFWLRAFLRSQDPNRT
jgi:hypothetical protein